MYILVSRDQVFQGKQEGVNLRLVADVPIAAHEEAPYEAVQEVAAGAFVYLRPIGVCTGKHERALQGLRPRRH